VRPSRLVRFRWWLQDLWDPQDARVAVGLLVLAVLVLGGFLAARTVARAASPSEATAPKLHVVTQRVRVRERVHGRVVTHWRLRKVYAKARTVMETQTIHTPHGIRVVTHPVTRYHVVYRKHVIKEHGRTRTVLQPVTTSQTRTSTSTQVVTVTRTNDRTVTVTQPVTVTETRTVVSTQTETQTVPVTTTVTLPGTTVTVP
jgi:hypothetical protein